MIDLEPIVGRVLLLRQKVARGEAIDQEEADQLLIDVETLVDRVAELQEAAFVGLFKDAIRRKTGEPKR
jgi:hypothetical protein